MQVVLHNGCNTVVLVLVFGCSFIWQMAIKTVCVRL